MMHHEGINPTNVERQGTSGLMNGMKSSGHFTRFSRCKSTQNVFGQQIQSFRQLFHLSLVRFEFLPIRVIPIHSKGGNVRIRQEGPGPGQRVKRKLQNPTRVVNPFTVV